MQTLNNTQKIVVDYHSHNQRCGHAAGRIEDYIQAGLKAGLTEIGISDHSPAYYMDGDDPLPSGSMAKSELAGYVDEVLTLKNKYTGQIKVRLGLEVDYIEGMEDFYRAELAKYPFDYLIGSVHHVYGDHVYERRRWDKRPDSMQVFAEYYRLVAKSAQTGMFDFLAHTSAILAFAPQPFPAEVEAAQDQALEAIQASGVAIEINTSGYRKMRTDPFPTQRMVIKAVSLGIPITFGSDSHRPDEVAYGRTDVEKLISKAGLNELATFEARQRIMIPIEEPIYHV